MTAVKRGRRTGAVRRGPAEATNPPELDDAAGHFFPPAVIPRTAAPLVDLTPDESAADEQTVFRIEHMTTETGWLLITAGVVGVIVPGIVGIPFLLAGAVVLTPGGPKLMSRWASNNPSKLVHGAMKQIGRFLDDLERRYPRQPDTSL